MTLKLYIGNTCYVILDGLRDSVSGSYINSATVTATVTSGGAEVSGETWPITLSYVGGSNGKYVGTISSNASLEVEGIYSLNVHVVSGSLASDYNIRTIAKYRTA